MVALVGLSVLPVLWRLPETRPAREAADPSPDRPFD
jgi:hypothetical protein